MSRTGCERFQLFLLNERFAELPSKKSVEFESERFTTTSSVGGHASLTPKEV